MTKEKLLKGIRLLIILCISLFCFQKFFSSQESLQFEQEAFFSDIKLESASKFSQTITEIPATITIIDSETIEKMGFKTLADILNFYSISGATFYERRYEFGIMRGFYEFADYNTRFLVLLDGVILNEPANNFVGLDRSLPIPLDIVERVEIIYGPFGVLYGTSNLGGVINIVTKSSKNYEKIDIKASVGSFNTRELGSIINFKKFFNINGFLSLNLYESDGIVSGIQRRVLKPQDNWYNPLNPVYGGKWEERADFERAPSIFGKVEFGDFIFSGFWGYRKKGEPYAPWGTLYGQNETWVKDEQSQYRAIYNHSFNPLTSFSLKIVYDDYSYREHDLFKDDLLFKDHLYYLSIDTAKARRFSLESSLLFNYNRIKYLIGGYYKREKIFDVVHYRTLDDDSPLTFLQSINSIKQRATSTYGMVEYKPKERIISSLALNYVKYSFTKGELLWRGSLITKMNDKINTKLTFGMGFRVPTFYEYEFHDMISSLRNPSLRSEKSPSLEFSTIITPSINKSMTFTIFKQKIEDFISYKVIESPDDIEGNVIPPNLNPSDFIGFQQYQNGGVVNIEGVSSSFNFVLSPGIKSHLNLSYYNVNKKENNIKERKRGSPRWSGNCGILYDGEKTYLSLSLSYLGDFLTSEGHTLSPFKVTNSFDGRVNFGIKDFLKKNMTLSFLIINPFNFSGKIPLSSNFVPEIGKRNDRSFILTLKYTY